jgi:hypothetical protein
MPVAGLVLTLSEEPGLEAFALDALRGTEGVTVGELQQHHKLPIATDADDLEGQESLWQRVACTPGVLLVDLVFEDFSDVGEFTSDELPSKWRGARRREERADISLAECAIDDGASACTNPSEEQYDGAP